ncbi:MAG: MAPEG family protein [Bdellovibrionales bacterium]|nr:MAPEG family protein [Bdellovibrionales bacterium]
MMIDAGLDVRALWSLVGMAAWTLGLVAVVVTARTFWVLGGAPANSFPTAEKHGPEWYWRAYRAHQNAVENIGVFAALVLAGQFLPRLEPLFGNAAVIYFFARVLQGLTHLFSTSDPAVRVRFAFFVIQLAAAAAMAAALLGARA